MKIELSNNKIFYKNGSSVQEIHPFWLRERANGEKFLDKKTQQRLFDPTSLNVEIAIKSVRINKDLLEIDFRINVLAFNILKNFLVLDKNFTYYRVTKNSIMDNTRKYSKKWWLKI